MVIRGIFLAFGLLAAVAASRAAIAQDNATCDAACDVPCYFGECAPARASYDNALARCDVERLELVGRLYAGTASGDKARDAAALLRSRGYGTSRIGVTPNAGAGGGGVQDCTALVEGGSSAPGTVNPCALVNVPVGWRCEIVAGRAELMQVSTSASVPTPAPAPVSRGAYGISSDKWLSGTPGEAGSVFREFSGGPEMVVIPAGSFMMGSPAGEERRDADEGPQRRITIPRAFALGRYEATFVEWDACAEAGYCRAIPSGGGGDQGWGRGSRPVITVKWNDTHRFIDWLNSRVNGSPYRLPSEAEWEHGARAGTVTPFSTGETISTDEANYNGNSTYDPDPRGVNRGKTVPVGSFRPNGFGLYDVHGNVQEWVEDCYDTILPANALSRSQLDCGQRVVRGGSWYYVPWLLRSANRSGEDPTRRSSTMGFRIARTLSP